MPNDQVQKPGIGQSSIAANAAGLKASNSLERYRSEVNQGLEDHVQVGHISKDHEFLPGMVDIANKKHVGLNASVISLDQLGQKTNEFIKNGTVSARLIAHNDNSSTGDPAHYVAFDYLMLQGKVSLIGVDSSTSGGAFTALMKSKKLLDQDAPQAAFRFLATDLQRSPSDCAMFSLSLAKQMFKERGALQALHEKNLDGSLSGKGAMAALISGKAAHAMLPPGLMKHAQSADVLDQYLASRPEVQDTVVNKRGETLQQRQSRHMVTSDVNGKSIRYSNSLEAKRLVELDSLHKKTNAG
jgi:YopJ protease family